MNKAAEIRAMFIECPHWTNRQIANAVGVHDAYVRVVRQRLDPERREKDNRAKRARFKSGDYEAARIAGKTAVAGSSLKGKDRKTVYRRAYIGTLFRTGSAKVSREAYRQ